MSNYKNIQFLLSPHICYAGLNQPMHGNVACFVNKVQLWSHLLKNTTFTSQALQCDENTGAQMG